MPTNKMLITGSNANYWGLSLDMLNNAQITITPLDHTIEIPKEPHWWIEGTVMEVIHEGDSDVHFWLSPDAGKDRLACEIIPQNPIPAPSVGDKVRVYGILRWDAQHGWYELHPIDYIEHL